MVPSGREAFVLDAECLSAVLCEQVGRDVVEHREMFGRVAWADAGLILFFNGSKINDGRSPGIAGILFDAPTATFHQDNADLHREWREGV